MLDQISRIEPTPEPSFTIKQAVTELIASGRLSAEDAKRIVRTSRTQDVGRTHPLVFIARHAPADAKQPGTTLTLESLTEWLAQRARLPYKRIDPLEIDVPSVTGLISHAYASRRQILPIKVVPDEVTIAVADPYLTEWIAELEQLLRKRITRVVANPSDISRYLDEFYNLSRSVKRALRNRDDSAADIIQNLEQLVELGRAGKLDAEDHHIVHIVDWLLQYAFEQRASDIHIEPRREKSDVRFRIDGVLHSVYQVPQTVGNAIVNRVKTLGRMDVAEKRRPQDGRLKTRSPEGNEVELRLSTVATAMGEKLVMRVFDPNVLRRSFHELGLTEQEFATWKKLVTEPYGIILVTGPTGSGKTTTLYSTLRQLATSEVNVCTIEDPIEMVEPAFNQMQVQSSIGVTFAGGVRSLLRQDPDIIMIGEIRDVETAEMAIQAALTGHLVFSTLHTNDAPSAITRLLEIGVPAYLINATLLGVVAQRLLRTLCPHCKEPSRLEPEVWTPLVQPLKIPVPTNTFAPKGCLECRNTGYMGRVGLYEILTLSPTLKKLITPATDVATIAQQALKEGVQPLRFSGARKIAAGITTAEEVHRVVPKETQI